MNVMQEWTHGLPMMQQTVLLTAIRGPDGIAKYGSVKLLLRWFRRCVLISAMDGRVLEDPTDPGGGSFNGPSVTTHSSASWQMSMNAVVDDYLRGLDGIPHHFQMHLMHAIEILGYKHPKQEIRGWWCNIYSRLVNDMHLQPETMGEMDQRLGDKRESWLARADRATVE